VIIGSVSARTSQIPPELASTLIRVYQDNVLALRALRAFDGERFDSDGVTVVIERGTIVGVEHGSAGLPDDCLVRDFGDATILPGLIDMHVHLCGDSEMGALDRLADYSDEELDRVIELGLRAQLAAGITTVRDLGDRRWSVLRWRDQQRSGAVGFACPTIVASGPPLTTRGGHCWAMGGEVEGGDALIAAVRERAERSVDVIKIMVSGGLSTVGTDVLSCQFTLDELRVVVEESHRLGLAVLAHAHGLVAVEQAIEAGVDGIEHCTCVTPSGIQTSDELLASLATRRIVVCPTLGRASGWKPPPTESQSLQVQQARQFVERTGLTPEAHRIRVRRMHGAGVQLVSGADAGIGSFKPHGVLPSSISEFVAAGIPAADALASATSRAAEACGLANHKGQLRPNYDADILIVDGDPSTDIHTLTNVLAVVAHGTELT
jgi:imidazolonepropionase-like amidohydrolase